MALFVEVNSLDKNCKVIINLDDVVEIAPLSAGGCALFFADGPTGKSTYRVSDSYELFKQFAMETVSADDIAKRVKSIKRSGSEPLEIPKL
jgi:hypothetical protein